MESSVVSADEFSFFFHGPGQPVLFSSLGPTVRPFRVDLVLATLETAAPPAPSSTIAMHFAAEGEAAAGAAAEAAAGTAAAVITTATKRRYEGDNEPDEDGATVTTVAVAAAAAKDSNTTAAFAATTSAWQNPRETAAESLARRLGHIV